MCLSLSFSNTRVHARDRNAHHDAGGCRRFQDSSPSRSALPGRKQRCVTPIDTDSLGPRSGFLRVTSRCTFPCSFCSRPRLRPHGRGRRFTQPRGRGRGVGAPRFVGPDPFAPRVLNVLCVSGVQRCVRLWLSRLHASSRRLHPASPHTAPALARWLRPEARLP